MTKGIDVSTFQGNIDWAKVKPKIDFAILRGGYGRYEKDARFERNYKECHNRGIPVGVYHYSYADTVEKAKQEADFCISYLKGKQFEYPVAFDVEDSSIRNLSKATLTEIVKTFCTRVQNAGYYVVIYASKYWLTDKLDMSVLKDFDVWVAQWGKLCTYSGNYGMWQYSNTGTVKGISGGVDLDNAYKDYPTIIKNAGLNGFKKAQSKPTAPTKPTKPTTPPIKTYRKGEAIKLTNTPIYVSAAAPNATARRSGLYYIYDGVKVNGRYRITVRKEFCGKRPMANYVTGWIKGE